MLVFGKIKFFIDIYFYVITSLLINFGKLVLGKATLQITVEHDLIKYLNPKGCYNRFTADSISIAAKIYLRQWKFYVGVTLIIFSRKIKFLLVFWKSPQETLHRL